MPIPFFKTTITNTEETYLKEVLENGDSFFQKKFIGRCEEWFSTKHGLSNFYLTKSCTHSIELAAIVLDIQPGDEVIMPSYSFVSCGNAVAMRGGRCVYVDILPDSMNIDPDKIEEAISSKTKAILTINYASLPCDYHKIRAIANRHNLFVIEDNAHGILAKEQDAFLGSFGDISTFSFDHMKNISCGQGGGIVINNPALREKFFVHYDFGTNRRSFFNKEADRYEWKNMGSNFQLSELNAAMLCAQLEQAEKINAQFVSHWNKYYAALKNLEKAGKIKQPKIEQVFTHNGHCFFIKTKDGSEKKSLLDFLIARGIQAQFHYTPLHNSQFGKMIGRFSGTDEFTTSESQKLLRLPLYQTITDMEIQLVCDAIQDFYK